MDHSVTAQTITIDFRAPAPAYKHDLGPVNFHLGCNALSKHPNCAICHPHLREPDLFYPCCGVSTRDWCQC
jgi:hypothetical protein